VIGLRLSEIARITGGEVFDPVSAIDGGSARAARVDPLVDGPVVTDSREAAQGSLFIARIGENIRVRRFTRYQLGEEI